MTKTMNSTQISGKPKRKRRPISENTKQKLRWIRLLVITFVILFILSMIINAIVSAGSATAAKDFEVETITIEKQNEDIASNLSYIVSSESSAPVIAEKATEIVTESKPEKVVSTVSEEVTEAVTEKVTEPVAEVRSYTDDDLFYLAAAVCREAGGATDEIQLLVANVVINRVNSSIYPNTIYEVLTQKSQYGTMWKYGISFPNWADQNIQDHCYDIARRILDGEQVCPENVLFQAEFAQGSGIYKQFGDDYYFCYY